MCLLWSFQDLFSQFPSQKKEKALSVMKAAHIVFTQFNGPNKTQEGLPLGKWLGSAILLFLKGARPGIFGKENEYFPRHTVFLGFILLSWLISGSHVFNVNLTAMRGSLLNTSNLLLLFELSNWNHIFQNFLQRKIIIHYWELKWVCWKFLRVQGPWRSCKIEIFPFMSGRRPSALAISFQLYRMTFFLSFFFSFFFAFGMKSYFLLIDYMGHFIGN